MDRRPARRFTSTPALAIFRSSDRCCDKCRCLLSQAVLYGLTQTERRAIHYVITKNTAYLLDESLEAYTLRSRELVAATNANTYGMWPSSALYSGGKFSTYHDPPSGGQASGVVGRTKDVKRACLRGGWGPVLSMTQANRLSRKKVRESSNRKQK